ncbi:MAG: hypothetical protein HYY23_22240 [Verrucomicrobia bacterium]|nr:hypothetical protein [Verrucomicrobiota bacterium]
MTITFRPTGDINDLLELAMKATGKTRTDLINAALRTALPILARQLVQEQRQAAEELLKLAAAKEAQGTEAPSPAKTKSKSALPLRKHQRDDN